MSPHSHALRFSENPDFDYEIRTVLGHSFSGAADIGEVLAAVAGVGKHDHDAWFAAWLGLADRVAEAARAALERGHPVSAASAFLRASSYYGVAVNAVASLASTERLAPTFRKGRDAWEAFVDATRQRVDRLKIPYEGTELPGYLFHADSSAVRAHPTLIAVNGSDGSLASLWSACISGGLARGYDVVVFDGPGQQSMLFEHSMSFRPDFEKVLTPVLDAVLAQPGVDAGRVAVYGISQGGYWVPRALQTEHRFAAAVADPGVVDVSASWMQHLPKRLVKMLESGQSQKFDHDMAIGMRFSPGTERTWNFRARPYGTKGYAETLRAVEKYRIGAGAEHITTPLLITDPEGEQFWPGQSQLLAALAPEAAELVEFTAAEGADFHCQPLARSLTEQRIFDWLDEQM